MLLVSVLSAKHHLPFHWHHPKCCKATSRYLNRNLAGTFPSDQKDMLLAFGRGDGYEWAGCGKGLHVGVTEAAGSLEFGI